MTFQPNPVAVRESRAMWRGARSFLLLLCYAGALSLVAYLVYSSEVRNADYWARNNGGEVMVQSARAGHTLFVALSFVQVIAWLLIAPALSATSISSERERGLLESLLMSQLKPRQIVAGKFYVSASFVGTLIVATLPILAMCFLLGGVSPGEFGGALSIQLATVFCALSLGVWLSASLRLSTHALGVTFGILFGWIVLSAMAFYMPDHGASMSWWDQFVRLLGLSNPLIGLNTLINAERFIFSSFFLSPTQSWPICIGFQVLAGSLFLFLAARALARPAGEEEEREARRAAQLNGAPAPAGASGASVGAASTWSEPSEAGGHFEVPLLSLLVAGDPLMRHHLRAAWRWKKPRGWALKWWAIGGALCVLGSLWAMGWTASYPNDASGLLAVLMCLAGFAASVYAIGSSGLSIARDRELGTWNGLRLSSIRADEIARAKMLAPLLSALGYATLLLSPVVMWTLLVISSHQMSDWRWRELWLLPLCFPFWALGTLQLSGWALICSMRALRSSIALVAAFAGALIWIVGFPVVLEISISGGNYVTTQSLRHALALLHPIYAFILASDLPYSSSYRSSYSSSPLLYFAALLSHGAIARAFYRAVASSIALREK